MRRPDSRLEALIAIGQLLAPKARRLAAEVTQAFTDPQGHLAAHAERMADRSIEPGEKVPDLPWIALVDALDRAGVLRELDWKTERTDVEWNLAKLRKGFRLPEVDEEESTWEMLERAGVALRKRKLQLAQLDLGSDAYPLVIVPAAKVAELRRLAKRARFGEVKLFGDQLAAATKERVARLAKPRKPAQAAPPASWIPYVRGDEQWWIKIAQTAFDTSYQSRDAKYHVNHYFTSEPATQAGVAAQIAAWIADGFREEDADAARAKGRHDDAAYIGWTAPFPEHARYFVENRKIVRCAELRGDTVWTTAGNLGKSFGELQNVEHLLSDAAAAKSFGFVIENHQRLYEPIAREALIAKYRRSR